MSHDVSRSLFFKAFIRVVKSIAFNDYYGFDTFDVVREPLIEAKDKNEVKQILFNKYPQFFQNGKVYEKETKDQAQFFYVVIFPLYEWEKKQIEEGEWICASCGQIHENKYIWTFEVLDELPSNMANSEVFKIESKYIQKFDSINNGFNSLISNKTVVSL
jgi:hypothetical protein